MVHPATSQNLRFTPSHIHVNLIIHHFPVSAVRLFTICLSLMLLFVFTSCGLLRRRPAPQETNTKTGDIPIGVVEMINPEQKFVLITLSPGYMVTTGTKLYTFSPSGLKAELKVTPERKFSFLTADIIEGYPQKGKPVFATQQALVTSLSAATAATDQNSSTLPPPPDPNLNWGGAVDPGTLPNNSPPSSNPALPPLHNPFLDDAPTNNTPSS